MGVNIQRGSDGALRIVKDAAFTSGLDTRMLAHIETEKRQKPLEYFGQVGSKLPAHLWSTSGVSIKSARDRLRA